MSTSSLYGTTDNVVVSSNNVTTLYNSSGGNIVSANVPDRNFTTLYTNQSEIAPTSAYGNANVEAFLNAGTDGSNIVQNINMHGNLSVGGSTYLGSVSNVHIDGGTYNLVLSTDGAGNLSWIEQAALTNSGVLYIHFDVTATANNQTFTDANLSSYSNSYQMSVFKNGVNIEPFYYTHSGNSVQVNILLNAGDTIDILPSAGGGAAGAAGGNYYDVQFNGGGLLTGVDSFTFNPTSGNLTVPTVVSPNIYSINTTTGTLTANGNVTLGAIGNVHITGGTSGQVISTDGLGNLLWATPNAISVASGLNATIANTHISGGTSGQVLSTDGANNLSWTSNVSHATTSDSANTANTANTATTATTAVSATTAGSATTAATVTIAAQPNITSTGTMTGFSSTGTVNFTTASNVALGSNSNVHLNGGTGGQVLSTDGSGNLSWISVLTGTPNYANFAGTVVNSSQPNITSLGTLVDLTVGGNLIIQRGYEKFTTVAGNATGTINYDILDQSILYYSGNATANFTLNFRGNGTSTFSSSVPTNDTVTLVFLNTVGATAYINNTIQIDGTTVTPKWVNGLAPNVGARMTSAQQSYTYTIMKTGTSSYNILASLAEFQ